MVKKLLLALTDYMTTLVHNTTFSKMQACCETPLKEGDKVVKEWDSGGGFVFGHLWRSRDPRKYMITWTSTFPSTSGSLPEDELFSYASKLGVYDRPFVAGDRIQYKGKEGFVCDTKKLVTVRLLEQEHSFPSFAKYKETTPIILPSLNEGYLEQLWKCRVGDLVAYKGWTGIVAGGEASIGFSFKSSTMKLDYVIPLDEVDSTSYYVGKAIPELSKKILNNGKWSSGLRMLNKMSYKNTSCIVERLSLKSLNVKWVERILCPQDDEEPSSTLTNEADLSLVFPLAEKEEATFSPGEIRVIRWNPDLWQSMESWDRNFHADVFEKKAFNFNNVCRKDDDFQQPPEKRMRDIIPFSTRHHVAVKVILCQTALCVYFNEAEGIVPAVLPAWRTGIGKQPDLSLLKFPDFFYPIGSVVKDIVDPIQTKYGFVMDFDPKNRTVLVQWVNVQLGKADTTWVQKQIKEESQYDIQPFQVFTRIGVGKRVQVVIADRIYEGVISGIDLPNADIIVRCAEGSFKKFQLHDLRFPVHQIRQNNTDGSFEVVLQNLLIDAGPPPCHYVKNRNSVCLRHVPNNQSSKYWMFYEKVVPEDHCFVNSMTSFVSDDDSKHFAKYVSREVKILITALESAGTRSLRKRSVFVQHFAPERPDLLTIVVIGAPNTLYEDVPFVLDIHLPNNYWKWEHGEGDHVLPRVAFRMTRPFFPAWLHPSISDDGAFLMYPLDFCLKRATLTERLVEFLYKVIRFFSDEVIHADVFAEKAENPPPPDNTAGAEPPDPLNPNTSNISNNNNDEDNTPGIVHPEDLDLLRDELKALREANECALVAVAEYVHSLLCCPPSSWASFLDAHFYETLPRMLWRWKKILQEAKRNDTPPSNQIEELNEFLKSKFYIYPISHSFKLAMSRRIKQLDDFVADEPTFLPHVPPPTMDVGDNTP